MPLPVIAGVHRVSLDYLGPNALKSTNVIHVRPTTTVTPELVNSTIQANWDQGMLGGMSTEARLETITVQPLDGSTAGQEFPTGVDTKFVGFGGGEPLLSIAHIITLRTGMSGRRRRGRIFLPFTAETGYDSGVLVPTLVTALQSEWEGFRANMALSDMPLVVASYGGVPPNTWAPFATEVSAVQAQAVAGTQRRRTNQLR